MLLENFEGMMMLHQISRYEWVACLIPKLQGRPRDTCADFTYTEMYTEMREVLQKWFIVSEEGSK